MKIVHICLAVFFALCGISYALTSPFPAIITDTDNDGIPDVVEEVLINYLQNISEIPVDDAGSTIEAETANTYYDTDSDGIPDIVEIWITHTNKNINDKNPASYIGPSGYVPDTNGDPGGDNLTGQWDLCVYPVGMSADYCNNVMNPVTIFDGTSVMHASTGAIDIYTPEDGFWVNGLGGTTTYTVAGRTFVAAYTDTAGDTFSLTGVYDGLDTLTGTVTLNAGLPEEMTLNFISKRISTFDGTENVSGIYSMQEIEYDPDTELPVTDTLNPTSFSFQQVVQANGTALVTYVEIPLPGYYVPSVGNFHITDYIVDSYDWNGDGDQDTLFESVLYSGLYLSEPADGLPIACRFDSFLEQEKIDTDGDLIPDVFVYSGLHAYVKNTTPSVSATTQNMIVGPRTSLALLNVPFASDTFTLTGPDSFLFDFAYDDLGEAVRFRSRLNPRTRGWDGVYKVGVNDTLSNVSALLYRSESGSGVNDLMPDGTYRFSFSDPVNTPYVEAIYTRPANDSSLLPVVNPTTILLNGGHIYPGWPIDFDTSIDNVLSWTSPLNSGKSTLRAQEVYWEEVDNEVSMHFQSHSSGAVVSMTIPAYSLDDDAFRITIQENGITDDSNRSRTTSYYCNDQQYDHLSLPGHDANDDPVSFDILSRSGHNSDLGFVLVHGRCGNPDGWVVSRLRRSLYREGYNTISIQAPAPASGCDPFTNYVTDVVGDNYVFPELYNRVNGAIGELAARGVKEIVLVGHSMGSRMASAYMANASGATLPVVGLVIISNYGDYGSGAGTVLDSTTTLPDVTIPVLDIYMEGDTNVVNTAANRVAAYDGRGYSQTEVPVVDSWSGLSENDRHKFHGYERVIQNEILEWVQNTNFALPLKRDFNADDTEDILVRDTTTGDMTLYEMDGSSILAETSTVSFGTVWNIPGIADTSNDRKADILLRHSINGVIYLQQMDGPSAVGGPALVSNLSTGWDVAGLADFGGDGKGDILLRHPIYGHLYLWPLDGSSKVPSKSGLVGGLPVADPGVPGSGWYIVGLIDFDGDGRADILVRHNGTGNMYMWQMDGYTKKIDPDTGNPGASAGGLNTSWDVVGVADFNGDRKADILARTGTLLWLYEMDGYDRFGSYSPGSLAAGLDIVYVGDFNGDGAADLLVRNTSNNNLTFHQMNFNTGLFLNGVYVDNLGVDWKVQ